LGKRKSGGQGKKCGYVKTKLEEGGGQSRTSAQWEKIRKRRRDNTKYQNEVLKKRLGGGVRHGNTKNNKRKQHLNQLRRKIIKQERKDFSHIGLSGS